ncbi:MAG: DUF368 domain-containing protein, partial [Lewinella sp.]|nr:DUF368 domain-containing protein [Lewinella sp.]
MEKNSNRLLLILKGAAMGIAETIPGVSGGTIAFITGIYERLLNAIKAFGLEAFQSLRKDGWRSAWEAVDGAFLLTLVLGMVLGIGIGIFGMAYLLDHYPILVW